SPGRLSRGRLGIVALGFTLGRQFFVQPVKKAHDASRSWLIKESKRGRLVRLRGADQGRSPRPRRIITPGKPRLPQPKCNYPPGPEEQRPWGSNRRPKSTTAERRSMLVSEHCLP